ncbi:MAG: glutamate racemase [Parcubacteria group bacterium]|nr:glutamate racemase [Parcubacteria group bacterium]
MLGIFDSGFGGLTVLKPIHELLPKLSTIYLGDNARAPYGVRSQDEIYRYTLEGVRFLFEQGCPLVLLACNTASAQALRRIQEEVMPSEFPDRRVLGVIRPAAEYLASHATSVGIFATPATVKSNAYVEELQKLNPEVSVSQLACPGLTDIIEAGKQDGENCNQLIKHFTSELLDANPSIEQVLLGCTHFPLIYDKFRNNIPKNIEVLVQGDIVANSLKHYLDRHPDILARIDQSGTRQYFTSGTDISPLGSIFYGEEIDQWKTFK